MTSQVDDVILLGLHPVRITYFIEVRHPVMLSYIYYVNKQSTQLLC